MNGIMKLSPVLAWGLLIALSLAIWAGLVAPLQDWSTSQAGVAERQGALLARQQGLVAQERGIRAELDRARAIASGWSVLSPGTAGAAEAGFQAQVRDLVTGAGLQLTRLQAGEASPETGFRRHRLTIDAEGELAAVQKLLVELPRVRPALLVSEATIRALGADGRLRLMLDLEALSASEAG